MTQNILDDPLLNPGPKLTTMGADADRLMGVRRTNTDGTPASTGSIAVTSTDITFYSTNDTTTAEGGAGATNFPDETGLADGVLDLSVFGSGPVTWQELVNLINNQPNWEAWLIGARPDVAIADSDLLAEAVAATTAGIISNAGHFIKGDTSAILAIAVGITNNNSSQIGASSHNNDFGFNHKLTDMFGTGTYTGTLTFDVYEVDDDAGTSTLLFTRPGGATTVEQAYSQDHVVEGKRLVVELVSTTTLSGATDELVLTTESVRLGTGRGGFYMSDNG